MSAIDLFRQEAREQGLLWSREKKHSQKAILKLSSGTIETVNDPSTLQALVELAEVLSPEDATELRTLIAATDTIQNDDVVSWANCQTFSAPTHLIHLTK